jgi:hypothetical protein
MFDLAAGKSDILIFFEGPSDLLLNLDEATLRKLSICEGDVLGEKARSAEKLRYCFLSVKLIYFRVLLFCCSGKVRSTKTFAPRH